MKKKPDSQRIEKQNVFEGNFGLLLFWILAISALVYGLRHSQYRAPAAARSRLLKPDYPFPGLPLLLAPFVKLAPHAAEREGDDPHHVHNAAALK